MDRKSVREVKIYRRLRKIIEVSMARLDETNLSNPYDKSCFIATNILNSPLLRVHLKHDENKE